MDISVFGYKLRVEILLLIVIIYLILAGHTLCGCSKVGLLEGYQQIKEGLGSKRKSQLFPYVPKKEGFTPANTNYGESSKYTLGDYSKVNTSNWGEPTLIVRPGEPLSQGVKEILDRKPQPVPLAKGQLLMFADTPFKPECCPNTYSNSSGCACMTVPQYNYLIERGGNNVPYSEY
jgi:hypothetical protein